MEAVQSSRARRSPGVLAQGLLGLLGAAGLLGLLAAAGAVRSPVFPADPLPLLAAYLATGVGVGVLFVATRRRPLLGGAAATALVLAALLGRPRPLEALLLAGILSVAALPPRPRLGASPRPGGRGRPARGGGALPAGATGLVRTLGAGLLATVGMLGSLAILAAVSQPAPSPARWALLVAGHLALAAVVGFAARAAESAPLVPAVAAVVGTAILARSVRTWVELPVEADQGHLLALVVAVLIVAVVAGARPARAGSGPG